MQVINLRVDRFRNLGPQQVDLCPGMNLFFGPNGQGKTNLLEAVYLLGYGRSFRTPSPRDCIRHGEESCSLAGTVSYGSIERELGVKLWREGDKQLMIFGKPAGLGEFIGNLHVLAFTQEHLKVVRGGPLERRAFLDRGMIAVYPGHMQRLAVYGRTLKHRNRMLGSAAAAGREVEEALLEAWDESLVHEGCRIVADRKRYVDEIREELQGSQWNSEDLEIHYEATVGGDARDCAAIGAAYHLRLQRARPGDIRKGFTSLGPHRDDLKLRLQGRDLADFGSAGQQRSCLLSLYFAQMEIHRRACGHYPVFLIDDVEAELDDRRLASFLSHLVDRTQTFLTTAKEHALPPVAPDARRFRVEAGSVRVAG